jgi:hypothetical protein
VVNLDRDMYLVVCDHRDGPYIPEVSDLARIERVPLIKDILAGQYPPEILAIIEFNPKEFTCRIVTEDFRDVLSERGGQY